MWKSTETDTDIEIITYCDGENCFLGHHVAEKVYRSGFERFSYFVNSWTKWAGKCLACCLADDPWELIKPA